MSDDKIILTPEEAISILAEGEHVHNYINNVPGMMIGCDYDRAEAEKHIRESLQCEIAGPGCQRMKHGLAVSLHAEAVVVLGLFVCIVWLLAVMGGGHG